MIQQSPELSNCSNILEPLDVKTKTLGYMGGGESHVNTNTSYS